MSEEIITKAKLVLEEADSGSSACKFYNDGFMDGVTFVLQQLKLQEPNETKLPIEENS